ncbi:hypothetical protein [Pseudomonas taeanensis]|uniref:hypothetical protein n=1 Tax=Pseudomonas taeanensis TaxID=574962 RepID=UPI002286B536|nr:hypothetical protein [Pseudomonas taeanensis]
MNVAALDIEDPSPVPGARSLFRFRVIHVTTSETPTRFRYMWFGGFDIPDMSPELLEHCKTLTDTGFAEDKAIIQAVHRNIVRDSRHQNYPEIIAQTDQAAIQARRKLSAQLARERTGENTAILVQPDTKLA